MREVILWGGTGQARVLNECLFGTDDKIVAVFDNASVAAPFPDVPLHVGEGGFRSWMKTRAGQERSLFPGCGGRAGSVEASRLAGE